MANQSNDLEQKKVIDLYEGYHLVLAPPGCGKTHVLAQRVVEAQKKGVDFSKMLCLTFTNRAARNMRKKIEETITSPNISDLFVGNIHRFCSQFLYDNKIIPMNTVILDEWDVEDIISSISTKNSDDTIYEIFDTAHCIDQLYYGHKACLPYNKLPNEFKSGMHYGIKIDEVIRRNELMFDEMLGYLSRTINKIKNNSQNETYDNIKNRWNDLILEYKSNGVSENIIKYLQKTNLYTLTKSKEELFQQLSTYEYQEQTRFKNIIEHLKYIYECALCYNSYKRDNDLLDFDDLLILGYEYLKSSEANYPNSRFSWVQIDEVQDLNPIQLEIIECITDKSNNHCVVYFGDEQQAIYSFMGAAMESLNILKEKCKPNIHHFGTNYRSPKYLLDLYNQYAIDILGVDPILLPKPKDIRDREDLDIILKEYSRKINQNMGLFSVLGYYMGLDTNEKIAILTSSNKDADQISSLLLNGKWVYNESKNKMEQVSPPISHVKISGRDFFSTPDMKTFLAHFNVVNFETNLLAWSQLLNSFNHINSYERWLIEEKTKIVDQKEKKYYTRKCPCCNKIYETERCTQYFCSNECARKCSDTKSLMFKMRNIGITPADIILERRYVKDFCENYKSKTFVIFDTETTGLNVFEDDVIQIAAIKVKNGEIVEKFNVVIRTNREIPLMLGNIVNPMVEVYRMSVKVSPQEAFNKFVAFVGDSPILAHNLNYDYNILKQNFIRHNIVGANVFLNTSAFDSLKLIRLIKPKIKVYKLKNLIEQLELEGNNTHNAEDDIIATKSLADYCFKEGEELVNRQNEFLADEYIKDLLLFFKDEYGDIYKDSLSKLYVNRIEDSNHSSAIVENMKEIYCKLADKKIISKSQKFDYFINFLEQDIVELQYGQSLVEQLSKYLIDINTFKEADYCDSESMKERVFVSTVHKAKGLEFDNVIVLNGVEGTYPFFKFDCKHPYPIWVANEENEDTKEGARLLYVAISRAKKRLCVTHYECMFDECFRSCHSCPEHQNCQKQPCKCCKYWKHLSRFVARKSIREFFYPYHM